MNRESAGKGSFYEATRSPRPSLKAEVHWLTKEMEWAKDFLPSEDPGFVVTASWSVKDAGLPVTPANVRARLQETGRLVSQLRKDAA